MLKRVTTDSQVAILAITLLLGPATGSVSAAKWQLPDNAPLLTRWSREVGPNHALPEYPRPQMVRKRWAGQRVLLHFGAVDWQTTVLLNGRELGGHRGGYDAFNWSNPLPFRYTEGQTAPRTELRDPCIIREGDTYYLVFTMWPFSNREPNRLKQPNQGGSPGIALYSSPDLKQWQFEKWLVKSSELPDNCPYKNRFWAPEIHKMGGRFFLIFTADNWLRREYNPAGTWGTAGYAFVGVADRISGPYEHVTYIAGAACDTSLFEDTNGRTFAVIPRYNIDIQEIDLTGLPRGEVKLLGRPTRIVECDNRDIGIEAKPDYLEGPWLQKIDGKYCLFYAQIYRDPKHPDWLGYWTGVAYGDRILGPWTKDSRGRVFQGGHLAVFDGPEGRRWFSYRGESRNQARGLLCIDPFDLDAARRVQCGKPSEGRRHRRKPLQTRTFLREVLWFVQNKYNRSEKRVASTGNLPGGRGS